MLYRKENDKKMYMPLVMVQLKKKASWKEIYNIMKIGYMEV